MTTAPLGQLRPHTDAAMEWLERGYRAGCKDARILDLDPFFASVRREPRYRAIALEPAAIGRAHKGPVNAGPTAQRGLRIHEAENCLPDHQSPRWKERREAA